MVCRPILALTAVATGFSGSALAADSFGQQVAACAHTTVGQRDNPPPVTCTHDGMTMTFATFGAIVQHVERCDVHFCVVGSAQAAVLRPHTASTAGRSVTTRWCCVGVFEPLGLSLRREIGVILMAGSSVLVAVNPLALERLRLPRICWR